MAKSPPEKLAAALRANLKRRKQGRDPLPGESADENTGALAGSGLKNPAREGEKGASRGRKDRP